MTWKWLIWAAAVPIGAAAIAAGVGVLLPRDHVATGQTYVQAPPDEVAALVRDVAAQPRWRKNVRSIDMLERHGRELRYIERSSDGAVTFDLVEEQPGRLFRSTIADPDLPFGGAWTIAIAPHGAGSSITIEEHGFVTNVLFRFFGALVFGYDRTIKAYLSDLHRAVSGSSS
jgi:hypothetical protein